MTEVSAGGVVFNDNEVLLLRKPNGEWVMPKGHVERNETPEQAAMREAFEETGLKARIVEKLGQTRYRFRTGTGEIRQKVVHWYLMEANARELSVESTFEEGRFFPYDVAQSTLTFQNDREMLRKAVERRGTRAH